MTPAAESSSLDTPGDAPSRDTKPTEESSDTTKPVEEGWGTAATGAVTSTVAAAAKVASSIIPDGPNKKSWASMFAAPKKAPAPVVEKYVQALKLQNHF